MSAPTKAGSRWLPLPGNPTGASISSATRCESQYHQGQFLRLGHAAIWEHETRLGPVNPTFIPTRRSRPGSACQTDILADRLAGLQSLRRGFASNQANGYKSVASRNVIPLFKVRLCGGEDRATAPHVLPEFGVLAGCENWDRGVGPFPSRSGRRTV